MPNPYNLPWKKLITGSGNKINFISDYYKPGECNIGLDEISIRKKNLTVSVLMTLIPFAFSLYYYDSFFIWLLLFALIFFATLMYLQIKNRFCVVFGLFGKYNFRKLGELQKTNVMKDQLCDRKKVLAIGLQTLLFSLIFTGLIYLLSGMLHF